MSTQVPKLEPTSRDREVIEALTRRVRLLTLAQIARTWWPEATGPLTLARRRLDRLAAAGYLESADRLARPEIRLAKPLARWKPGRPVPDAARISHLGRSRFTDAPRTHRIFWASPRTMREHVGIRTRAPRTNEISHDLHLAQVFLRLRDDRPELAIGWTAEWMPAPRAGRRSSTASKKPDALVRTRDKVIAIEFVGHYTPHTITEFHTYCARRGYWYELW